MHLLPHTFVSLNKAYILSSELSDLPKAISLLTCVFGDQDVSLAYLISHNQHIYNLEY